MDKTQDNCYGRDCHTHTRILEETVRSFFADQRFWAGKHIDSDAFELAIVWAKEGNLIDAMSDLSHGPLASPKTHWLDDLLDETLDLLFGNIDRLITCMHGQDLDKCVLDDDYVDDTRNILSYLGYTAHMVQDFYAHTNWCELFKEADEPKTPSFTNRLNQIPWCSKVGKKGCDGTTNVRWQEVSWTVGNAALDCLASAHGGYSDAIDIPNDACSHGGANPIEAERGINKDNPMPGEEGTRADLHYDAALLAGIHTKQLLEMLYVKGGKSAAGNNLWNLFNGKFTGKRNVQERRVAEDPDVTIAFVRNLPSSGLPNFTSTSLGITSKKAGTYCVLASSSRDVKISLDKQCFSFNEDTDQAPVVVTMSAATVDGSPMFTSIARVNVVKEGYQEGEEVQAHIEVPLKGDRLNLKLELGEKYSGVVF